MDDAAKPQIDRALLERIVAAEEKRLFGFAPQPPSVYPPPRKEPVPPYGIGRFVT